jgi:hypothetical protein
MWIHVPRAIPPCKERHESRDLHSKTSYPFSQVLLVQPVGPYFQVWPVSHGKATSVSRKNNLCFRWYYEDWHECPQLIIKIGKRSTGHSTGIECTSSQDERAEQAGRSKGCHTVGGHPCTCKILFEKTRWFLSWTQGFSPWTCQKVRTTGNRPAEALEPVAIPVAQ